MYVYYLLKLVPLWLNPEKLHTYDVEGDGRGLVHANCWWIQEFQNGWGGGGGIHVVSVENKLHTVHIPCWLQIKYKHVKQSKFSKTNHILKRGCAPGALVLDAPLQTKFYSSNTNTIMQVYVKWVYLVNC